MAAVAGGSSTSARVAATKSIFSRLHQFRTAYCAQVEKLLVKCVSKRGIVRLTSMSRLIVAKLAKRAQNKPPSQSLSTRPRVLELDEMWALAA